MEIKGNKVFVKVPKSIKIHSLDIEGSKKNLLSDKNFVIVGGGPAGMAAVESLRQSGFGGKITIISKERHLPYDRTMLTKSF